jgi:hypothetical protein
MFDTAQRANCTWSHTSWGRGSRSVVTELGFYVIEHLATGKFIVAHSRHVSQDVDQQIAALIKGNHPNRLMQTVANMPDGAEFRLHEYPSPSLPAAKDACRKIKLTACPTYLLLNP